MGSNNDDCNRQGSKSCPNYSDACASVVGHDSESIIIIISSSTISSVIMIVIIIVINNINHNINNKMNLFISICGCMTVSLK